MSVKASVIYPNPPGSKFDLDYYLKVHMPLVQKSWGPYGLKGWEIIHYGEGLHGARPEYNVQAILEWEKPENITAATTADVAKEVFDDIPKFTDTKPLFLGGKVVGTGN